MKKRRTEFRNFYQRITDILYEKRENIKSFAISKINK